MESRLVFFCSYSCFRLAWEYEYSQKQITFSILPKWEYLRSIILKTLVCTIINRKETNFIIRGAGMDGHSYDSPEKKKWLKNKNRTLGNCPPTGIKRIKKPTNKIFWVISKIALGIYYIAFLFVSYGVGMEAHAEHHAWIVADALNGLAGGVFLVYPFNIFRQDVEDIIGHW